MTTIYSTSKHTNFFASLESARASLESAGYVYQSDMADFLNGEDHNGRMTFIAPANGIFEAQVAYIGFHKLAA